MFVYAVKLCALLHNANTTITLEGKRSEVEKEKSMAYLLLS